jgi:hypothetical protein
MSTPRHPAADLSRRDQEGARARLLLTLLVAAVLLALAWPSRAEPFPDLTKDPADVANYTMDWTSRLPAGVKIASIVTKVNGDIVVVDRTPSYPATVLTLQVSSGSSIGWTGDPQISALSVVTVIATCADGEIFSRSFNVIVRSL